MQRGDVRKSSFAFRTIDDDWGLTDQGFPLRTLTSVQLVDVAPVNLPAYHDTTAGLRSLAAKVGADLDEVRALAEADELLTLFTRVTSGALMRRKTTLGAAAQMAILTKQSDPWT